MTTEKLKDTFSLPNGDTEVQVFMSYGILGEITKVVPGPEDIAMMGADPLLSAEILHQLLSERDANGKIIKEFNSFSVKASPADISNLISWVQEHVMDFFLTNLEKIKELETRNGDRLRSLMPSSTGSELSASMKASSGLSSVDQANYELPFGPKAGPTSDAS